LLAGLFFEISTNRAATRQRFIFATILFMEKNAADESAKRTFSFGVADVFCDTLPPDPKRFFI
jgi:hypothetical protein